MPAKNTKRKEPEVAAEVSGSEDEGLGSDPASSDVDDLLLSSDELDEALGLNHDPDGAEASEDPEASAPPPLAEKRSKKSKGAQQGDAEP
eukprot:CAMPEP_0202914722 /NCGR_PEP_ID=MMETSP1392-20130828/63797_1 /ASSEMBLY_ACC=CAM_ASM_000868 /TAXON_ID=225041 /ORGANISM="Chlamydomonas chlamydogama, Strain SAG 11-48b" /LENGTH=89 /DNA_ID=CAMNT_0049606483 /DNA_START=134 /DNA_END=400 /DNA_ORIENTATION=-